MKISEANQILAGHIVATLPALFAERRQLLEAALVKLRDCKQADELGMMLQCLDRHDTLQRDFLRELEGR